MTKANLDNKEQVNYLIVKVKHTGDIQEINEEVDYEFKHKDILNTEIVGIEWIPNRYNI